MLKCFSSVKNYPASICVYAQFSLNSNYILIHCLRHVIITRFMGYWQTVRSRWLDVSQVLFGCLWTKMESRSINMQKRTRPKSSYLDWKSLVNKGFIIWDKEQVVLVEHTAHSQVVKIAPSCLLGWASHTVSFNHVINKKAKEISSVQELGMNEILSRHAWLCNFLSLIFRNHYTACKLQVIFLFFLFDIKISQCFTAEGVRRRMGEASNDTTGPHQIYPKSAAEDGRARTCCTCCYWWRWWNNNWWRFCGFCT